MTDAPKTALRIQQERLKLLELKLSMEECLPHLHGWPWYQWAFDFFQSRNKQNFICAANQISKSSTQIRKAIHWATERSLWPELWNARPLQFWYLYPSKDIATIEFEKKWMMEFLPRGEYVDHPVYGWKAEYKNHGIWALHFNSGVSIYFKTYAQDEQMLQAGSCSAIFTDEEVPEHLYDELMMRLTATDGYFHMVFTATLGQEFWRETMEEVGKKAERFPDAFKRQISMYDCLEYMDGKPSPWTIDRIKTIEGRCKSRAAIDRRVNGRFVVEENLQYGGFDRDRNVSSGHPLPPSWQIYGGVDIGSGGPSGSDRHPAAIVFVAVNPEFTKGRVFRAWRGDDVETTAGDIFTRFQELRDALVCTQQSYDPGARDFYTIATRAGDTFSPADKARDTGISSLNTLFKMGALIIYDEGPELKKLITELCYLQSSTRKQRAKDDLIDALRYALSQVPWNWDEIMKPHAPKIAPPKIINERKERFENQAQDIFDVEDELAAWDELYDPD